MELIEQIHADDFPSTIRVKLPHPQDLRGI
jgi:hypothetical protein